MGLIVTDTFERPIIAELHVDDTYTFEHLLYICASPLSPRLIDI